jgi:hypothetical protein
VNQLIEVIAQLVLLLDLEVILALCVIHTGDK